MRLNSYMAKSGVASRRASDELILSGRVMVNNKVVRELGSKVEEEDVVQVDGQTIELVETMYYVALNKPRGYVCTNYDPNETKYARDLIDTKYRDLLFNVGRLDKDSNGLVLFTNDGEFMNKMLHPKFEIEKEYLVKLDYPVKHEDLERALSGIYIDEKTPYKIKRYDYIPDTRLYFFVTLTEGKNREIRKIFEYFGYRVKSLTRVRFGSVVLGNLEVGDYRNLTKKEVFSLLSLAEGKKGGKP